MSDIVIRQPGAARSDAELSARSLLEFESPTASLVSLPVQGPARATIWLVAGMFACCAAAAGLVPVDKVVVANGRVVPADGTVVVQPLETSIVRAINVREGQVVKKGDVLARLDPTFAAADSSASEAQAESLQAEVDRLTAEATGQPYHPTTATTAAVVQASIYAQRQAERRARLENYAQKISSLQAAIARNMSDVQQYRQRLAVAEDVERMRMELQQKQVGSRLNTLQAQDTRLEMQRGLENATAAAAGAARDLQAMQAERDAYDQNWRGQVNLDLTEASRKLSDARESMAKAKLRHQLVDLRAEQDAVVLTIAKVSVGSVLQSGDQFITLVPENAQLEVEANVAGADAGFVRPGEPVTLKFDTFPFIHYGTAEGTVRILSADSFTSLTDPQQRGAQVSQGQPAQAPYYKARITIDALKLHDLPENFRVVPGMPVTSDVKVGKRTVLSYVFSRVLPVAMDGMREP